VVAKSKNLGVFEMNFPRLLPVSADLAGTIAHAATRPPLVVFSHLRWGDGNGRLQQLMTRLAQHYRVLVVEPPLPAHEDAWLAPAQPAPGVELLVPHTRVPTGTAAGYHPQQLPTVQALLGCFLDEHHLARPVAWLTTPMALPLVAGLAPRAVVYDCMDDLAARLDAPAVLARHEAALLELADVVIAAGPSLYQSRRALHSNVHCIPNAVDADHFTAASARTAGCIEAVSARALHAAIPTPRMGWFGPIDERIDLDLVASMADARPDWHLVMAGPVEGVAPATLPRRPNIHWAGPQTYAILPHLLAHWDACLLPLKCDETTRCASPHQVLEYLAAQKPVVSTPVHHVATLYGHVVRLAGDTSAFIEACRSALCERGPLRRQRRIDALIAVHSCTWNRAVERIHQLIIEVAHEADAPPPPIRAQPAARDELIPHVAMA
jgi:glycosyltransferase involved in cell wall biosynthesis